MLWYLKLNGIQILWKIEKKLYELIVEQDQPNDIYFFNIPKLCYTLVLSLKHSPQHAQLHNLEVDKKHGL